MRILAANKKDWTHPTSGGAEVNLRETLTRLADRGHEVHLITSRYPGSDTSVEIDGVKIHRHGVKRRTNELYIFSIGQIHLNRLILKLDPDVMYLTNSIMTWIPLIKKDKIVSAIHHLNGRTLLDQMQFPLNYIGFIAEKAGIQLSKYNDIVTVSPDMKKELMEKGFSEEEIREIRNGVDSKKYSPGEEAEEPTVLYLGRVEHSKGADLLPLIDEHLKDEFGDYRLEIAGFGRRKEEIENFSEGKDHVTFHQRVSEEKKRKLLKSSWVLAVPSRKEGWSLTVAEAAASGTPAVGFAAGGLKTSIKHGKTGVLVPPKPSYSASTPEFAEKLAELLENKEKRDEMRKNAVEVAQDWSWERAADRLERIFEQKR